MTEAIYRLCFYEQHALHECVWSRYAYRKPEECPMTKIHGEGKQTWERCYYGRSNKRYRATRESMDSMPCSKCGGSGKQLRPGRRRLKWR